MNFGKRRIGKKGFGLLLDIVIGLVLLLVIAMGFFFVSKIYTENLHPALEKNMNDTTIHNIMMKGEKLTDTFDYIFLFILLGLLLALIISAFLIRSHPALAFLVIFAMIIFLIFATIFSNVFGKFATQHVMTSTAARYPIIIGLMDKLPLIVLIISVVTGIIIYAKTRSETGL